MSGTSADGVDVAIVRVNGRGLEMSAELILHHHRPYDAALKQAIFALRSEGKISLAELARIGREISLAYATCVNDAVEAANLKPENIAAIAAHGQTLYHQPPDTIQWLDPALIAAKTGCAVVSDFRRADCAAGGQGAPLVPFTDYILFRHPTKNRILLNIGGIANLTYIRAGGSIEHLIAFDTGPGNCISDWICRQMGPFGLSWDVDGAIASRSRVIYDLEAQVLAEPFFSMPPPKSTDGPAMIGLFDKAIAHQAYEMDDLIATAAHLTAAGVAIAVTKYLPRTDGESELITTGGGVYNKAIMGWLKSLVGERIQIRTGQDMQIRPDAKEAIAFALLGAATLDNFPANVPSCTGASRAVVLGSITPRPYNSNQ